MKDFNKLLYGGISVKKKSPPYVADIENVDFLDHHALRPLTEIEKQIIKTLIFFHCNEKFSFSDLRYWINSSRAITSDNLLIALEKLDTDGFINYSIDNDLNIIQIK